MNEIRIVSFLPAATEMACALGLVDQLVGITHECDHPPAVQGKQVVVRTVLGAEKMSPSEIDTAVSECLRSGRSLYEVDVPLLRELAPTHILTQALCSVCAPAGAEIAAALNALPSKPQILSFTPKGLEDIHNNLRELGRATARRASAERLIVSYHARLQKLIAQSSRAAFRPRVFCLEWTDPYYGSGHWVPEMVEIAGGIEALGHRQADSTRVTWSEIAKWAPEILIVMPCGFGVERAAEQAAQLLQQPGWSEMPAVRQGRVFAVDANAYFARPGPRVIDGAELLAHLIHPKLCDWQGPAKAFRSITCGNDTPRAQRIKCCPECGAAFACGPRVGKETCWCDELPPLSPMRMPHGDCFCPNCIARRDYL